MIDFGSTLNDFISVGASPSALPHGAPLEQSFVVPDAHNAEAVVYQASVATVPPGASYEVVLDVGTLSEWFDSETLTEAQMMAVGKSLAPVTPGG